MSAGSELQAAIVEAASRLSGLTGVFDGPPARAEYPYLVVDCGHEQRWNCSPREGREVTVSLSLWDDRSARLMQVEEALGGTELASRDLPGWEVSSLLLLEKKKVRSADGPWATHVTMRARLLAKAGG